MKNLIFIFLVGIVFAACGVPKDHFTIKGNVQGIDTGIIILQKLEDGNWVKLDSAILDQGNFMFKGTIGSPEIFYLNMSSRQVFLPVFLENALIEIKIIPDDPEKTIITGSATQDIYQHYLDQAKDLNTRMESVYKEWKMAKETKDSLKMKIADSISTELDKEMKKNLVTFAKSNSGSVVSPFLVMRNSWQFELSELEEMMANFDTSLSASTYIQTLNKRIEVLKTVAIGQLAPDFTMLDSLGHPVSLSSLKGNILLVDFWASWCGPCRAENPNVVKAYQTYHKKGFDILGVSFDKDRKKWINATKDDKLCWTHVSDLKGWGNAAGKLYAINSIPANVLLDKDQRIIGRNLRGNELMKKLQEIFMKK